MRKTIREQMNKSGQLADSNKVVFCKVQRRVPLDPDAPCWLWGGTIRSDGYGVVTLHRKVWRAHRLTYENLVGSIPAGLDVLHTCDVRRCVQPAHLFVGTDADNHQDKARKGRHWQQKKTHCPKGHPYSTENTYTPPSGGRHCRICRGLPVVHLKLAVIQ